MVYKDRLSAEKFSFEFEFLFNKGCGIRLSTSPLVSVSFIL